MTERYEFSVGERASLDVGQSLQRVEPADGDAVIGKDRERGHREAAGDMGGDRDRRHLAHQTFRNLGDGLVLDGYQCEVGFGKGIVPGQWWAVFDGRTSGEDSDDLVAGCE